MWEVLHPVSLTASPYGEPFAAAVAHEDATGAVLSESVEDAVPPLGTPPDPGWVYCGNLQIFTSLNPDGIIIMSDLVARAFGRNKPKPDCFNYDTLDNHADICIFCPDGIIIITSDLVARAFGRNKPNPIASTMTRWWATTRTSVYSVTQDSSPTFAPLRIQSKRKR